MRALAILCLALTGACSGVALNTRVADTEAAREAMAYSVIPGTTTETALITRWGLPVQKVRTGAQIEYIYRNMWNPKGTIPVPNFGDSENYVIVTFQYGLAVGVRTSDEIDCRGTFAPRPPNYAFDNPTEVRLVGTCAPPNNAGLVRAGPPPMVDEDSYLPGDKGKTPVAPAEAPMDPAEMPADPVEMPADPAEEPEVVVPAPPPM